MEHLRDGFTVSERRACRTVDQPRSTQWLKVKKIEAEKRLLEAIEKLVIDNPPLRLPQSDGQPASGGLESELQTRSPPLEAGGL